MVKKHRSNSAKSRESQLASTVKESAAQIWLAGLGAFSKAQAEGGKVFEALVKEGGMLQQHSRKLTEDKLAEITGKVSKVATDLSQKANGTWDKFEGVFEERVARALKTLGVPTSRELEALNARLDAMSRGNPEKSSPGAKAPRKSATAKPQARRAAPRKKPSAAKKTVARKVRAG